MTTSSLMTVKTLFPSHVNEEGITKGCMILLKLKRNELLKEQTDNGSDPVIRLKCTYENAITGKKELLTVSAAIPSPSASQVSLDDEWFESPGVRKAIALTHYINLGRAIVSGVSLDQTTGIPTYIDPKKILLWESSLHQEKK
ncbi:hypothetical protein RFI_26274 [Reticulomyxa filosa]|uniref:Uncharacterized protein n=1 Tax=Reticulomyxa filosa TaxID=46433 RepID=X6MCD3_RETFI|nr:hypothetical protein RFI_26274 [Reticulomyxa filosa]|eukprot:ETO11102.1 hypothetical protein RFI_26274 [Reticulomyxa filosa]